MRVRQEQGAFVRLLGDDSPGPRQREQRLNEGATSGATKATHTGHGLVNQATGS
jgi:hypothetical protein